jgi:hypothetical protein
VAGKGVMANPIGTTRRRDGASDVTDAGHPLYCHAPDRATNRFAQLALGSVERSELLPLTC